MTAAAKRGDYGSSNKVAEPVLKLFLLKLTENNNSVTQRKPSMNNMTTALRNLMVVATIILASTVANASSVTFNGVANSIDRGGVYSGLYSLTLDTQTILGMCDSRNSFVSPPSTWTADIRTYADIQAGLVGKFNSPSTGATLAKYSQAGWLYGQMGLLLPTDYSGQADVQEAIWKIMIPSYVLVGGGASAYYASATDLSHDAFDWSTVMRVVTANPLAQEGIDIQEFLIGPEMTVVPVPAAAWLFGSAFGLLGMARRRVS